MAYSLSSSTGASALAATASFNSFIYPSFAAEIFSESWACNCAPIRPPLPPLERGIGAPNLGGGATAADCCGGGGGGGGGGGEMSNNPPFSVCWADWESPNPLTAC